MSFNSVIKAVGSVVIYGVAVGVTVYELEKLGMNKVIDKIGEKDDVYINYLREDKSKYIHRWIEAESIIANLVSTLDNHDISAMNECPAYKEYLRKRYGECEIASDSQE